MKAINKEIARLVLEIIICIGIIISTHFMWDNLEINNFRTFASNSYSNTLYIKESVNFSNISLVPMSYEKALESEKGELEIENLVNLAQDYTILIVVAKDSTLNIDKVNILIDDIEFKLIEQNRLEDDDYYYIILNSGNVKNKNHHKVRLYLDESIDELNEEKSLNYYFEIKGDNKVFAYK